MADVYIINTAVVDIPAIICLRVVAVVGDYIGKCGSAKSVVDRHRVTTA